MEKLPIFLHIPKNAGNYVSSWCFNLIRKRWLLKYKNPELGWNTALRHIAVKFNNETILALIAYDPLFAKKEKFKQNPDNPYLSSVELEDLIFELENNGLDVSSIHIESNGFKFIKTELYENLCKIINRSPIYFCILRDPFSRAVSMFHYLKGDTSIHETTHGKISSKSFIDYLKSYELEDSWIIRCITGISDNKIIDENDFIKTCEFLDKVRIKDIKNVDQLLNEIFIECYSIDLDEIHKLKKNLQIKNESASSKVNIQLSSLEDDVRNIFLNRTVFDYKIYNKYTSTLIN